MAITLGTQTNSTNNATTTKTWAHVVEAGCKLLIVRIGLLGTAGTPSALSVTYGGQAMTYVPGAHVGSGSNYAGIWYLKNPPVGSNNVVASWTTSAVFIGSAVDIMGTSKTPVNGASTTVTTANPSLAVAGNIGDLILDCLQNDSATITSSTKTNDFNLSAGSTNINKCAGSHATAAGASTTMGYTASAANPRVLVGCSIPQEPSSGFFAWF